MVHRTMNLEDVSTILNHPKVYRMISDDLSPERYDPVEALYVINDEKTGTGRADPFTGTCCSVHIAATPELWGKAESFAREAIGWVFSNTIYSKMVAFIPEYNRLAISLANRCGFSKEGLIHKSFLKNFVLYNQVVLGLTKREFGGESCQQRL